MALWPFRRKSSRKRARSGTTSDLEGPPPRSHTDGSLATATSTKKQRTEPAKLHRRARAYSFSPGRNDSIRVDRARGSMEGPRRSRTATRKADGSDPAWERTPTLHHKRTSRHPTRRRSSKRKRHDNDREAELKAMSSMMPVRPATEAWGAGRPMKKDTKRAKTMALGNHLDRPASDISLPIPASLHSSMSSDSEYGSYKVSAFSSLAPRPTLRYAPGTRWTPSHSSVPARSGSQKRAVTERGDLSDDMLKAHKRIDDLADDLDASDLRALMERDQRRRDRKRERDHAKAERKLAHNAEKRRNEVDEARKTGTPPPENLDRGVVGRELVGLGIEPASAVVTSSKHRSSETLDQVQDTSEERAESPLDTYQSIDAEQNDEGKDAAPEQEVPPPPPRQQPSPPPEAEEPVSALPPGSLLAGLLRSKKSRSKSTLDSDKDRVDTPQSANLEDDSGRKDSETSNKGNRFSLSAFLKRGGRRSRDSGPSSFSNTSREEMQALQAQVQAQALAQAQSSREGLASAEEPRKASQSNAEALAKLQGEDVTEQSSTPNYLSRRPSAGVPKRTRSRFREDLPDFPLSPPASRVQSPEAESPLPPLMEQGVAATEARPIPIQSQASAAAGQTPSSTERTYAPASPDAPHSMSLASIDSEGSWLSGRANSRRTSALRDSLVRASRRGPVHSSDSPTNSTQEDLAIIDDEYMSRLTPHRDSGANQLGRRSGEGRPSSDEEDYIDESNMKWGAVGAKPRLVHNSRQDRETIRSQQGMLDMESADEESESPVSPAADEEKADLQRARSVQLGQRHARNFSAGSAKLLDITPRESLDQKRLSRERRQSVPLDSMES